MTVVEGPSSRSDGQQPSAALTAWWAMMSPGRVFSCSACLTQVEDGEAGDNEKKKTILSDDYSMKPTEHQQQQRSSDSCARGTNLNSNSLIDDDSNKDGSYTNHVQNSTTSNTAAEVSSPFFDDRPIASPIINCAVVTPHRGVDHSSTNVEFGSLTREVRDGDEIFGEECPICLHSMSTADLMYPLQCPTNCKYNFCIQCMESLLKSSKDPYQIASDGSLRVKVQLNCPNCRASIKHIIEDVIFRRQEYSKGDGSVHTPLIRPSKAMEEEMNSREFLDNVSTSRLRNRARARARIRHERKKALIEELNSIPAPSLVREHVFALHTKVESFTDSSDDGKPRVPSTPLFSSTLSLPFHSGTMDSFQDSELKACHLRRSKSFEMNRNSPTCVLSEPFWTRENGQNGPSNAKNKAIDRSRKGNIFCLCFEETETSTGSGDDGLAGLALNYLCCSSYDAINSIDNNGSACNEVNPKRGCGGYVDYLGIHHQCRASTCYPNRYSLENCQGCVFRSGMYDGYDNIVHPHEELYYDSDCGQQFAVNTWASPGMRDGEAPRSEGSSVSNHSSVSNSTREKAKSLWKERRNRCHSGSNSDVITSHLSLSDVSTSLDDTINRVSPLSIRPTPSTPTKPIRDDEQADETAHAQQQAYIYHYFSRYGSPMRTGTCSTKNAETVNHVQDALNSRWRLEWHVASRGNSKACEVWIERGYFRNRGEIVEPKLMWRELTQSGLQQGILGGSTMNPYRISLFALRRIVPIIDGNDWQRKSFDDQKSYQVNAWKPMVKPNCLIAVRSSVGQDYLFEASCQEERDRIIHLWKMTTARLVSHAMVGNSDMMMREFFNETVIQGGLYASMVTTSDGKADERWDYEA